MAGAVQKFKHFEAPREEGVYYRLVCLTGQAKGEAYLFKGKRIVLGRSDKVDIRVLDIKSSREHAEIIRVGKDYVLTDLGSQNGIVVNDLKVKQHVLSEGDKLIIGQTVYKFNKIEVKNNIKPEKSKDNSEEEEEEEEEKSSRKSLIIPIIILAGLGYVFLSSDSKKKERRKKAIAKYRVDEISSVPIVAPKKASKDTKVKKKLEIYFHKGLREFSSGNYYRALTEFEHALSWSPSDPQANFYHRKTQEALDKRIDKFFNSAKRDEASLKYKSAAISYCSILRVLYRYPDDKRYKDAKEMLSKMEGLLGLDEGAINCIKELE